MKRKENGNTREWKQTKKKGDEAMDMGKTRRKLGCDAGRPGRVHRFQLVVIARESYPPPLQLVASGGTCIA